MVPFVSAPKAPRGLTATPGDRRVTLTWQPPEALQDGAAPTGDIRYVVLRGTGASGAPRRDHRAAARLHDLHRHAVENDVDYRYAVRAVRVEPSVSATGETSATVAVAPTDTTPPPAPAGLVAVPSGGAIRLAWNPSPEADVAAYAVYRAAEAGDFVRIATTVPPATVYTDRDVRPGTTYRYAVTAIDRARKPNESARSNVVSVRARVAAYTSFCQTCSGACRRRSRRERPSASSMTSGACGIGVVVDGRHRRAVGPRPAHHHQVADLRAAAPSAARAPPDRPGRA